MIKTATALGIVFLSLILLPSSSEAANELSVRCSATPTDRVIPGELVSFRADARGGRGTYTYEWSGSDGLSGSSRTIETSFPTEGTKRVSVTVTSGNERRTANCPTLYLSYEPLRGWCAARAHASNEVVSTTWSAGVRGGTGSYTINWSGTEGLFGAGNSVTKTYTSGGTKSARAYIRDSAGYELALDCSVTIPEVYKLEPEPLSFGCTYASSDPLTRYNSRWQAFYSDRLTRSGRNDPDEPTFRWKGSERLSDYGSNVSIAYEDMGRKFATVESVSDRGRIRVSSICEAFIIDDTLLPDRSRRMGSGSASAGRTTGSSIAPRNDLPSSTGERDFNTAYSNPGNSLPSFSSPSCFITSATEESEDQDEELEAFRNIRDSYIAGTPTGDRFIRWYYEWSKKSAPVLERNVFLQSASSALIHPLSEIVRSIE